MSAAASPALVGFVEAATGTRVLGWAWRAGTPTERVGVALLLGDKVVAEAIADQPREDLARNGVGDGRHAFDVAVPEPWLSRAAELVVVARAADGAELRLEAPPAGPALDERIERLQRGLDALVGSQRVLHRTLQSALVGERRATATDDDRGAVREQIATLEVFVTRLDERLAALAPVAADPVRSAWLPLVLACVALAVSLAGFVRALPG